MQIIIFIRFIERTKICIFFIVCILFNRIFIIYPINHKRYKWCINNNNQIFSELFVNYHEKRRTNFYPTQLLSTFKWFWLSTWQLHQEVKSWKKSSNSNQRNESKTFSMPTNWRTSSSKLSINSWIKSLMDIISLAENRYLESESYYHQIRSELYNLKQINLFKYKTISCWQTKP